MIRTFQTRLTGFREGRQ